MISKIGAVIVIVIMVSLCYLLLLVVMPVLTGITYTVNSSLHAASNMTNYPGTAEGIIAAPWVLFFVPGVIGIAAIIVVLREQIWRA